MKKLFVCALAASMFTACSQDETISQQSPMQISFANAFVNNATRALKAEDPSTTDQTLTAFDVWGFMNNPSGVIFEGEDVTGSQGNFSYANTQYWVANNDYYFAALAPMNMSENNLIVNVKKEATADMFGLGEITFNMQKADHANALDGSIDLLYAAAVRKLGSQIDDSPVKFEFKHLLSKVKFTFKNGFTNPNTKVEVLDIQMKAPYGPGVINLNQQNWWSTNQWLLERPNSQAKFFKFGDAGKIAYGSEQESANERLLFPTSVNHPAGIERSFNGYIVTFTAKLWNGEVVAGEYQHEISLTGVDFVIGHAYDLVAELNSTNIDPSGESLKPIVFDVQEVKKWDKGVAAGVGANVATEAELHAAAANGGNIYLAADITLEKAVEIKKNTTLNLNGHNLEAPSTDAIVASGEDVKLIINGEGNVKAATVEGGASGNAVWAHGGATVIINGGNYYVGSDPKSTTASKRNDCIYAGRNADLSAGYIYIYGGEFSVLEDEYNYESEQYWVLNLNDKTDSDIKVFGGTYKSFDPSINKSENPKKDFVAEGYKSVETETGIWKVIAE